MPIYKGTYWEKTLRLKEKSTGNPIDISGWEFRSQIRTAPDATGDPLLELTTDNGNFVIVDGPNGVLTMKILAEDTADLEEGYVYGDILRTDADPGPRWQLSYRAVVAQPVTRDE